MILHWPSVRLGLLSPSRARGHRGHGGHAAHGSSLDGGLVRYEPEENSGGGGGGYMAINSQYLAIIGPI